MRYVPNAITALRIIFSFVLFFVKPFSSLFLFLYVMCGISDILDGYIARKIKASSKTGAILDSIADAVFVGTMLWILIPLLNITDPIKGWILFITLIKLTSLVIGFIKYKQITFLHTYLNKFTGVLLFCFPFIYHQVGMYITGVLLCMIASIAAIEECILIIISKEVTYDIRGIFFNKEKGE
jgi:CDP-diacylglycerol--glycerol-3-phosphate 3-phosphatidyltransferase